MIQVTDLKKHYQMGDVTVKALDGVNLEIPKGKVISLMGKSGSGKSTLLHQIGLLDTPTGGEILIDERQTGRLNTRQKAKLRLSKLGYVFQEYAILPGLTALENVMLPAMMLKKKNDTYHQRAQDLLQRVGLAKRTHHLPRELSGGEQQRVAIARALINEPDYILADEPAANLDTISSQQIMETLVDMNEKLGVTVLFVSHDPDDKKYASEHIYLKDGRIVEPYF